MENGSRWTMVSRDYDSLQTMLGTWERRMYTCMDPHQNTWFSTPPANVGGSPRVKIVSRSEVFS